MEEIIVPTRNIRTETVKGIEEDMLNNMKKHTMTNTIEETELTPEKGENEQSDRRV